MSTHATPAADVELRHLVKRFGDHAAVDDISLSVRSGELLALLGPSGCGKTTTLRIVAGFEDPTSGEVLIDGQDAVGTPPHKRNVNTVFQNYALFPHLDVLDNVAYGLKQRKVGKAERRARGHEALELVRMNGFAARRPAELSGGQQQRVALARALVLRPKVLLLDEPLGALDLKLRKEMQLELKRIQEEVGVTTIIVTHDQEEAMALADRIAVMDAGRIQQLAPPGEVYDRPSTAFVAEFIGELSLLDGTVVGGGERPEIDCGAGLLLRPGRTLTEVRQGDRVRVGLRPEHVRAHVDGDGVAAEVRTTMVLGREVRLLCTLPNGAEMSVLQGRGVDPALEHAPNGSRVHVRWGEDAPMLLGPTPASASSPITPAVPAAAAH